MNPIQDTLVSLLPHQKKSTPSGWISFNAVCCHNRGQSRDSRSRGGVLLNSQGGWQYHCFNCNFKAGWTPGKALSSNTRKLFDYLGLTSSDIQKLQLVSLKYQDESPIIKKIHDFVLQEKSLPDKSLSLKEWANLDLTEDLFNDLLKIFKYLDYRGMSIDWYPWYWSPIPGFKDRLLIPFFQNNKIVGYTGRKITDGKPKYLTDSQPGYVFNIDAQNTNKTICIVVEGQFDAIAIDGVAIMSNEPNETQITRLKNLNKEIIIVPDRDKAGSKLLNAAIEHDWSVSCPNWEKSIKDVADAVKKYGRTYVLYSILSYKETNKLKIELLKKKLHHERI